MGEGHTKRRLGNLENDASTAASSGLRFVRVLYRGRSDPLSAGWTDIFLFLFNGRNAYQTLSKSTLLNDEGNRPCCISESRGQQSRKPRRR